LAQKRIESKTDLSTKRKKEKGISIGSSGLWNVEIKARQKNLDIKKRKPNYNTSLQSSLLVKGEGKGRKKHGQNRGNADSEDHGLKYTLGQKGLRPPTQRKFKGLNDWNA